MYKTLIFNVFFSIKCLNTSKILFINKMLVKKLFIYSKKSLV